MTSHPDGVKLAHFRKVSVFVLILLISISLVAQMPKTQAATPNPGLQEKALSFLRDVIQLDMSKYTLTLNDKFSESNHLFFNLDLANMSPFDFGGSGNAIFSFYDGVLGSCSLSSGYGGLLYLHPELDYFNATLGMVERYQMWTNDSQVQEMADLLKQAGSERNATEVSGNLTLRLSVQRYTQYAFYNTFNGADYTGLTIFRGGPDLDFSDSRVYEKIGDTNINVSKEQAIRIAEDYLKTYTANATFANGTTISVTDLNVTGVNGAILQTTLKDNSTLYPEWNIQLNVSNMPARGLQGIGVWIWANDGTVIGAYQYTNADFTSLFNALFFFPLYSSLLFGLIFAVIFAVALIVVLIFVFRKSNHNADEKKP